MGVNRRSINTLASHRLPSNRHSRMRGSNKCCTVTVWCGFSCGSRAVAGRYFPNSALPGLHQEREKKRFTYSTVNRYRPPITFVVSCLIATSYERRRSCSFTRDLNLGHDSSSKRYIGSKLMTSVAENSSFSRSCWSARCFEINAGPVFVIVTPVMFDEPAKCERIRVSSFWKRAVTLPT